MLIRLKSMIKENPAWFDRINLARRWFRYREDDVYRILNSYDRMNPEGIVFVQIGANDGLRNDLVREFVVRGNWHGIMVEPLPGVFELLKNNYAYLKNQNVRFLNCAVSVSHGGILELFTLSDEYLSTLSREKRLSKLRKASLSMTHFEKFVTEEERPHIRTEKVESITFSQLIKWGGISPKDLNVLVIDAEGHEYQILSSIDFSKLLPEVIIFESHHLGDKLKELHTFLEGHGYVVAPVGPDSIAACGKGLKALTEGLRR